MDQYDELVARAVSGRGVYVLVGGMDTGKTTLAKRIASAAVAEGLTVGLLDADVGQSTIGPPTTVGFRLARSEADLAPEALRQAEDMAFVGSISPQGHLLPLVVGTRLLLDRAKDLGAELVVVDTTGQVSGVYAQLLKFHKIGVLQPDLVVGLARGEELEPVLGVIRRFYATEIATLPIHANVVPTSVEKRA